MTQFDMPNTADLVPQRYQDASPATRVTSTPDLPASPATWPYAQQAAPGAHNLSLAAAAVLAPEFSRVPVPENARWLAHGTPLLAGAALDAAGLWANSDPAHVAFASVAAGLGGLGMVGAIVATVASNWPARYPNQNSNPAAATKMIGGGGTVLLSLGAMIGNGVSGVGCVGAVAEVVAAFVAWAGWIGWRRRGNQEVVIALADSGAFSPPPVHGGIPLVAAGPAQPMQALPVPTNPYAARVLSALEKMGYGGGWAGAPREIGENAWKIQVGLPQGRNISPEKIVAQPEVLRSNMLSRRIEIESLGGNLIEITAFDGEEDPLREGRRFPWDKAVIESLADPMEIAVDEAKRPLELTIDGHVLISGSTGSGKSKLTRLILARTLGAKGLVRFGIDCKPGSVELGMFEPAMHYLAKTAEDAVRLHWGLKALIEYRGMVLQDNNDDTWTVDYGPELLIASDERAAILRWFPKAANLIEENMQMIRFVGGKFIDATQTPSAGVYGNRTDARHQYDIRIGLSNESTVNQMVFGGKASSEGWRLENLDAKGKLLIRTYAHRVPRPYKSLWAERAEVQGLVAHWAPLCDALDEGSARVLAEAMDACNLADFSPDPPRGGKRSADSDSVQAAQDFTGGKPGLHVVRTFPDGAAMNEARALLWDTIGEYEDGFTYSEIASLGLPGYGARTSVQTPLDTWRNKGWLEEIDRRGNAAVYRRCTIEDEERRREKERKHA